PGVFSCAPPHRAVPLAARAETAPEIDVPRPQRAAGGARRRLQERQANWDHARARAALERALNRLRVAGSA
ncbi:MAG: F0F1 ATP synthase subunit epsilon, partial [Bacillota bacterium]